MTPTAQASDTYFPARPSTIAPGFANDARAQLAAMIAQVAPGNLNHVFIATDASGRSLVLKQSLPYVRMVGESWPLSQDRILAEARGYDAAVEFSEESIPAYYGLDEPRRFARHGRGIEGGSVVAAAFGLGKQLHVARAVVPQFVQVERLEHFHDLGQANPAAAGWRHGSDAQVLPSLDGLRH